jgi:hypothetical protein
MAVFTPIRAFVDASPVDFRMIGPAANHLTSASRNLVAAWVIADDGRLTCCWRVISDRSAA